MSILNNLLLWLHLIGLAMGGGALIGAILVARLLPTSAGEQRSLLFDLAGKLSSVSRAGLVVLIITGPLMLWLRWGGHAPSDAWFGVKMLFVLVVIIGVVVNGLALRRLRGGDATAVRLATRSRIVTAVALVLVVLAAAFAFS